MDRANRSFVWCVVAAALRIGTVPASILAQSAEASAHEHHATTSALGHVHFPNSGAAAAQAPFLRGIALLHSFEYDDAADAFRLAEGADRTFALPYWFEAFTHSHLLWGEDDTAAAHGVLARLDRTPAARLARARTSRERSYAAAIEAFYADTDEATRCRAFADSMTHLAARDPRDLEAAAFASLALQLADVAGAVAPAAQSATERDAIALAERVFKADPKHPGAAHYLIHIVDMDPSYATAALPVARAYAKIAPDAEHALHMPSHVFLPLGLWSDLTASNERAWAASRAWVAKHGLSGAELDFHSLSWLEYGYLQEGRWAAARALIDIARSVLAGADVSNAEHVDARFAVSDLAFLYAAETGRWSDAVIPPESSGPPSNARERVFATIGDYQRHAIGAMRSDTTGLADGAEDMRARVGVRSGPPRRGLDIMATELEAMLAQARKDEVRAGSLWTRAAAMADSQPPVGPPLVLVAHEVLGARLFAAGHAQAAAAQYEDALDHLPNRSGALLGLARARASAGDSASASAAYRRLLANWSEADTGLPVLEEARRGAGRRIQ
jgi:tetratricopeptide (TPR) repeat protein